MSIEDFDVERLKKHFEIESINRMQIGNYSIWAFEQQNYFDLS